MIIDPQIWREEARGPGVPSCCMLSFHSALSVDSSQRIIALRVAPQTYDFICDQNSASSPDHLEDTTVLAGEKCRCVMTVAYTIGVWT